MHHALWGALVAGTVLLRASSALAQTTAGVETKPPPTWHLQLSADGSWYENSYFTSDPAVSSWSASGQVGLSHTQRFRTGSYSLSAFGGALYYPEIDSFTQPTYGGAFGLEWAPSRRTHLRLGQSYDRSNTRNLRTLDLEGLPLPTSGIENATSTLGFDHQLSPHWQLGLGGAFTWRRYDDESLVGGEQMSGAAQLARSLGKHSSTYLSYGYSSSWFEQGKNRAHQALLGIRKQVERGASVVLAGGVAYLETTAAFYPAGRASLSAAGRRTSFTLGYYRDFGQAWGYGRQMIGDMVSAGLGWTPARRLSLNAGYNFGYRRDPADETYTIRSHVVGAGLGWQIARGLSFGGNYSWERNQTEGQPVVDGQRVGASLSYGVDWK